jgi:N-acylneuraminate cytidylyltransferase
VVRTWVTGRDIHTRFDAAIAEWWLERRPEVDTA